MDLTSSLYIKKNVDFSFCDDRGLLVQISSEKWEQVNFLFTKKGVVRGKHYHKEVIEAFYIISGRVEVTFELEKSEKTEKCAFEKNDFFIIPPLVKHTLRFTEDTQMVAFYNKPVINSDGRKDIYE